VPHFLPSICFEEENNCRLKNLLNPPLPSKNSIIDPLIKEVLFTSINETQTNSEVETNLQLLAVEK